MPRPTTRIGLEADAYLAAVDAIEAAEAADIAWSRAYRTATDAFSAAPAWRASAIEALEQAAFDRSCAVGDAYDAVEASRALARDVTFRRLHRRPRGFRK